MDKEHDHLGPWWSIGTYIVIALAAIFGNFAWDSARSDNFSSRLAALERDQDCPSPNTIVITRGGEELCLDLRTATPEEVTP